MRTNTDALMFFKTNKITIIEIPVKVNRKIVPAVNFLAAVRFILRLLIKNNGRTTTDALLKSYRKPNPKASMQLMNVREAGLK